METWKKDHQNLPQCSPRKEVDGDAQSAARKKIDELVKGNHIVLFMKGTKDQPMCGFSAQVVSILNEFDAEFVDVNILADEAIRAEAKVYTNWPTFPQLYVDGKFVGGCDICVELYNSGEMEKILS